MKKKWFWALILALLFTIAFLAFAVREFNQGVHRLKTADAVHVISGQIGQLYLRKPSPTPAEIDQELGLLHDGSITHVVLDKDRKPMDLWGTPFRILRDVNGARQTIVTTSAGPDRQFGTPDDISYSLTSETR